MNKLEEFKANKEKAAKYEQLMKEAREYSYAVLDYMVKAIDNGVKDFSYVDGLNTESVLNNPYLRGCIWDSKVLNAVIPLYNDEKIGEFKFNLLDNKLFLDKSPDMVIISFETLSPDVELDDELDDLKEGNKEETEDSSVHGFIKGNLKLPKDSNGSEKEKEESKSGLGKIALGIAGVLGAVGLVYLGYKMFRD